MIPDPQKITAVIREAAEKDVLPRFQSLEAHEITEKAAGDIVTIADEDAEQTLSVALQSILPGSVVVGEEGASRNPIIMDAFFDDTPVWVIDPVDGTQNFADGKTCFAMIVALVANGETVAGWVHEPVDNRTVWAVRDEGTFEEERRLHIASGADLQSYRGSMGAQYRRRLDERRSKAGQPPFPVRDVVRYRCVGAEYADLARGQLDFARYGGRLKPWDHAAGALIVAEAGGYGALISSDEPYRAGPTLKDQILLLAPDALRWRQLCDLMMD